MSDEKEEFGDAERPQRPRRDGQGPRGDRSYSPRSGAPRSGSPRSGSDRSSSDRPYRGDRPNRPARDAERREYKPRDGERRPYGDRPQRSNRGPRDGQQGEWKPRDGERREWRPREGDDRKPYGERRERSGPPRGDRPGFAPKRDGERREYRPRDGEKREYKPRDGERRPYGDRPQRSDRSPRDGERREHKPRDGERREYKPRDGERREWKPREGGERRSYGDRPRREDGQRSFGDRKQYGDRPRPNERGERDERPELTPEQLRARELRMVRPRHDDPEIDADVTQAMLDKGASNELKTLTKENAEFCAEHLVMAARLIDENPEQAHQHALSASRRGGRIPVIRETLAITAYASGDFALALRELRTFRRISGSNEQIALMVDSERGIGRPDRALELGRSVDRASLTEGTQVALAIAMSGARLDLDQVDLALAELEIPQLDPKMAFSYSPALFRAYAEVLEELGRHAEAADWIGCAEIAEKALEEANPELDEDHDDILVFEEELSEEELAAEREAELSEIAEFDAENFDEDDVAAEDADELVAEGQAVAAGAEALELGSDDEPVDLDVLEDDVRQILEETAHLDNPKNRSGE